METDWLGCAGLGGLAWKLPLRNLSLGTSASDGSPSRLELRGQSLELERINFCAATCLYAPRLGTLAMELDLGTLS